MRTDSLMHLISAVEFSTWLLVVWAELVIMMVTSFRFMHRLLHINHLLLAFFFKQDMAAGE